MAKRKFADTKESSDPVDCIISAQYHEDEDKERKHAYTARLSLPATLCHPGESAISATLLKNTTSLARALLLNDLIKQSDSRKTCPLSLYGSVGEPAGT
jgi:hypothetical protein